MTTDSFPRVWDPGDGRTRRPSWYALLSTREDGGFSQHFFKSGYATHEEEREAIENYARRNVKPGQHWKVYEKQGFDERVERDLGQAYFMNAWEFVPGTDSEIASGVRVRMPFARAIFRHHIREVRDPLLNALDVEFYRAQEAGTDTTEIVAKKQVLRDLPQDPAIDAATTPQELLDAWPTALLGDRPTDARGTPEQGYYESPGTY